MVVVLGVMWCDDLMRALMAVNRDREYVLDSIYGVRVRDVKFNFTKHIQHRGSGDDSL
jgi:hypothetical protein